MRYALAAVAMLGLAGLGLDRAHADSQYGPPKVPHPSMNLHQAIYIHPSPYWYRCGYGIYGLTDCPNQPVNGLPATPFCPRLGGQDRDQSPAWHRYIRSPRDFWMLQY